MGSVQGPNQGLRRIVQNYEHDEKCVIIDEIAKQNIQQSICLGTFKLRITGKRIHK